jgi:hypothetical protein
MGWLTLLEFLPTVINAVEALFGPAKGQGPTKKSVVQGIVGNIVDGLNATGSTINKDALTAATSLLIDAYVAVANVAGWKPAIDKNK